MLEERVPVGDAELWTASAGAGPGLVLAHGGPGMSDNLGPMSAMVENLVRVHRYDQRACGRSGGRGAGQTVSSAVADLDALRDHWGHERWVVGGHSWGAALALFYAVAHPERTRALIYVSGPGVAPRPESPRARSRTDRLSAQERAALARLEPLAAGGDVMAGAALARLLWRTDFANAANIPDLESRPLFDHPRNGEAERALAASANGLRDELADRVADVRVPVLVLHGDDDPSPVECAEDLARRLPSAELVVLDGVGHNPWLEDAFGTRVALRRFLARLPP